MPTMPETACLHVQARETDPVRVIDLRGGSARVGRAAYCDVRLPGPELPDEVCRLRRRAGVWQLVPVNASGPLRFGDEPVERPRPIAFGESFRVGTHVLTLEPSGSSPAAWRVPDVARAATVEPVDLGRFSETKPTEAIRPVGESVASRTELSATLRTDWDAPAEGRDRWFQARKETRKWESRWRAAGEKIKSAASRPAGPPSSGAAGVAVPRPATPPTPAVERPSTSGLTTTVRDRPAVKRPPTPRAPLKPVGAPVGDMAPPTRSPITPAARLASSRPTAPAYPPAAPAGTSRRSPLPVSGWAASPTPARSSQVAPPEPEDAPAPAPRPEIRLDVKGIEPSPPEAPTAPRTEAIVTRDRSDRPGVSVFESSDAIEKAIALADGWDPRNEPIDEPASADEDHHLRPLLDDDEVYDPERAEEKAARPRTLGSTRRVSRAAPAELQDLWGLLDDSPAHGAFEGDFRPFVPAQFAREAPAGPPEIGMPQAGVETSPPSEPLADVGPGFESGASARPARSRPRPSRPAEAPEPVGARQRSASDRADRLAASRRASDPAGPTWLFHDPIVADTNLGDSPAWSGPTPFVAATGPVHQAGDRRSRDRAGYAPSYGTSYADPRGLGHDPAGVSTTATIGSAREWPTVSDILAAQGGRGTSRTASRGQRPGRPVPARGPKAEPVPTEAHEPDQWGVPLWLGWLPAAAVALSVGAGACFLTWTWARDAHNAGVVAGRLGQPSLGAKPLPEGVAPGRTSWWATSATHLVEWAAYLDKAPGDSSRAEESRALLGRAVEASPLQASARFAIAHPLPGESATPPLVRALGPSRDVVALTWSGRQLLATGKKAAALRAYRAALEMAARSDPARPVTPAFLDDPQTRRYALPTEDLIGTVVRDMADQAGWSHADWAGVVPRGTAAPAVVARVLRERASPDAGTALDAALAELDRPVDQAAPAAEAAVRLAAQAETLAMKGRWSEAGERYRRAIDRMPVDIVRRAWWMNVADIALRLNEESARLKALDLAKSGDTNDEITVRAVELQKASGFEARREAVRTARAPDARH